MREQAQSPGVTIHPIVLAAFCLCLASFPFEFPERTFRWEVPTMTTSLFLFTTLFQPRAFFLELDFFRGKLFQSDAVALLL